MSRPTTLMMPLAGSPRGSNAVPVEALASIIIIGANGSGKTRLGAWLEFISPQHNIVHRVGAQRSIQFPSTVSPAALIDAEVSLLYGVDLPTSFSYKEEVRLKNLLNQIELLKRRNKWRDEPETGMLYDYKNLLTYLFSEHYDTITKYVNSVRQTGNHSVPPETDIDKVKRIWEQVLPHRELIITASDVRVKLRGATESANYAPSSMSDGERVTFYLIGQSIAAPINSIIVIDEPEIHLHRAIQTQLWEAVEQERTDCLFVYLTHDLEFAASRSEAKKLWLKSYNGEVWQWAEVPDSEGIPDEILLTVLGSRKPVLFTEGDRGGYEQIIFSHVYSSWNIVPCGNCEQVIDATQSFTNLKHLHGNECRGIIDRDYRTEYDAARLTTQGVFVLETQEVENLMLDEAVLTTILTHAIGTGALVGTVAGKLTEIKTYLFEQLARDQEKLSTKWASWEVEKTLRKFGTADNALGLAALQVAVATTAALPVESIYLGIDQEFTRILAEKDYLALLRLYNNKGLAKRIGHFFNLREPYPDYFERLLSIQSNQALVQALRAACPVLPVLSNTHA